MQRLQDDASQIGYGVLDVMNNLLGDVLDILPDTAEEARIPTIGEKGSNDF